MVRETELSVNHLVYPVFVKEMSENKVAIPSMPGIHQFSPEGLLKEIDEVAGLSIPAILLFGIPEKKDETGSGAFDKNGIIPQAVRAIKKALATTFSLLPMSACANIRAMATAVS
jgi:porphobilinogen synthase